MLTITKEFHFHSAHQLLVKDLSPEENFEIFGKCYYLHGHTYQLKVSVAGELDRTGMIINFTALKTIITEKIIDRYDHRFLNDFEEYQNIPTTVENVILHIHKVLKSELASIDLKLISVTLYETPTAYATLN